MNLMIILFLIQNVSKRTVSMALLFVFVLEGRPCPFGNLCKIASIVSPKYWHSSCVLMNGPKSYCKCIKGYFGRAKVKGCFAPKGNHV